jgi:hypothetical protein
VIYHDDLWVVPMVQRHSLAKSISDAGWSAFLAIRAFKAAGREASGSGVTCLYQPAMERRRRPGAERACRCAGLSARTVGPVCIDTTTWRSTVCGWGKRTRAKEAGTPPSCVTVCGCPVRRLRSCPVRRVRTIPDLREDYKTPLRLPLAKMSRQDAVIWNNTLLPRI